MIALSIMLFQAMLSTNWWPEEPISRFFRPADHHRIRAGCFLFFGSKKDNVRLCVPRKMCLVLILNYIRSFGGGLGGDNNILHLVWQT